MPYWAASSLAIELRENRMKALSGEVQGLLKIYSGKALRGSESERPQTHPTVDRIEGSLVCYCCGDRFNHAIATGGYPWPSSA